MALQYASPNGRPVLVIRYRALFCALATSVTLLAPGAFAAPPTAPAKTPAPDTSSTEEAGPKDAQALKALQKALEEDFLETRFDDAIQRLRGAVKSCGSEGCSHRVLARLHAALGSILAGGKRELEDGRDAFIDALMLDPKIKPDPEISSAAVTFSFEQAQRRLTAINSAAKNAAVGAAPVKAPASRRLPPPPKPPHARENWVSVTVLPDFTLLSGNNICTPDSRRYQGYTCLLTTNQAPGVKYNSTPTVNGVGESTYGDNVNFGFSAATLRVLIGYERLLFKQLTLGVRLGMAFDPKGSSNVDFSPFHAEGRLAYFPRPSSFLGTIVRPYLSIAGGIEQVNTRIDGVEVLEDGKECGAMDPMDPTSPCAKGPATGGRKLKLFAYKRAGLGFIAGGAGLQIAPIDNFSINLGVRGGITFPIIIGVISPEIGASVGF